MKHRAPPRRVRVPHLGEIPLWLLARIGGALGVVVLGVGLSLIPLLQAHHDAKQAEQELNLANSDLAAQHVTGAQDALVSAREHVRGAEDHLDGPFADLWSHVPLLGPAVDDGRHLVAALDEASEAARIGVDVIARATAPGSDLIVGTRVNLQEVRQLSTQARAIGPHLTEAQAQLREVRGDDPLVGGKIATLKAHALSQLAVTRTSYQHFRPLLARLPDVLGARKPQTYLVTIMNPAEQRFSGGATLQMATLHFDRGVITFGKSQSVADVDQAQQFLTWKPVTGNIFHTAGPKRLASATFSPWWQVSGEELLRAWQAQTGQRCQGLIAVDLQAIATLFQITGPMDVPGYGRLDAQNLVKVLAGSYDKFQDPYARRRLNNALVPAFQQKLLSGGDFIEKGRSLVTDAQGRHAAFYFRDLPTQRAFAGAGFSGNLSTTRHDYMGVFSQNLNGSKSDYWQSRHVSSKVSLRADGSASESVSVVVQNPAPPYLGTSPDPRSGYDTRWLGLALGIFLPVDTHLVSVMADGKPLPHAALNAPTTGLDGVVDRPLVRHSWELAPAQSGRIDVQYDVPRAAIVDRTTGDLTYDVSLDPQDLVQAQSNAITLSIPAGYHFGPLPSGWTLSNSRTAVLWVPQLTSSRSWRVPVLKGGA